MRHYLVVVLLFALIGGCTSPMPTEASATITGRLVAGPTCPVETDPPDPACAPHAVPDAEVVVSLTDGGEIRTHSDQDGAFRVMIPPGEATITFGAVDGLMAGPDPVTVGIAANQQLELGYIAYDTGIR